MRVGQKAQTIPLEGKPSHLRTVTADVEKQQAVVEAFRVSYFPSSSPFGVAFAIVSDLRHLHWELQHAWLAYGMSLISPSCGMDVWTDLT